MIRILIVDDELPIANLLRMNLTRQGYVCTCAYSGPEAADLLEKNAYDLVLLDIMLPGFDGYDLLAYIRPMNIPVIFLTAKSDLNDRVKGLKLGAEDYIVKPFEMVEVIARIEVVLRRYHKSQGVLHLLDIDVDLDAREVLQNGVRVDLTRKEFDLLLLFAENPNKVFTCDQLYDLLWSEQTAYNVDEVVKAHIKSLRQKLSDDDSVQIKNVWGVGYRFCYNRK